MRTYGRIADQASPSGYRWIEVSTDAQGRDDMVWLTTLIQCLKLVLGESPFYSNYGIPAQRSVVQQFFPDFYVSMTQNQFAQYFASLIITKLPSTTPTYRVALTTLQGVQLTTEIAQ